MTNLNSVLLEGALIADPELSYTPQGAARCGFEISVVRTVIVGEAMERQERFFKVRVKSRMAEVCAEYLRKGRGVRVVGRLDAEPLGDSSNPLKHHGQEVFIAAEHVEFKPQRFTAEETSVGKPEEKCPICGRGKKDRVAPEGTGIPGVQMGSACTAVFHGELNEEDLIKMGM